MKAPRLILALLIAQTFCLFFPLTTFCQTETLDIVTYTPPKGWTKTPKAGAVVFRRSQQNYERLLRDDGL